MIYWEFGDASLSYFGTGDDAYVEMHNVLSERLNCFVILHIKHRPSAVDGGVEC